MASVRFLMKGKTDTIYVRFKDGNRFDLSASTKIKISPKFWDNKNQKIRNVIDVPNRDIINERLLKLKLDLINNFNQNYTEGEIIDKNWLNEQINVFYNRPKDEGKGKEYLIYLSDFARWWIKEKAPTHKVSASRFMDEKTIGHYEQVLNNLEKFQGKNKIKLKDTTAEVFDDISNYLTNTEKYSSVTVKRKISRLKFFCNRAEEENIPVNKGYKTRVFVQQEEEQYKEPYLNESEIETLFKLNLTDQTLNNVRDNWIIGLWTGLRISDFLTRLDISNISDDFIEIKTKKTGNKVAIPLHPQVREVLKKYNGNLPPKISEQKFNEYIKIIGEEAGFTQEMIGGIIEVDEKTKIKRKKIGSYPKYKLITSHICRRSFCTNLIGKVPNQVIMSVAGWSNEKQMLEYVKLTNLDRATELKKYWEEKYNN